ncbi:coiled-coil domain-containing protein 18 isoform X1 [Hippocampus zosterae]|uniref:coiled-coil domain-containing protein 18 isoform X1 n=1 Tax=Hippocampus zosterae TaxID=109293 RepID=UPI00223CF418|nr:coiled-coil domain-containing protein 18 isoform X1 [Hippocampus zosterae]XP_051944108.1 coiled-coil domain-containing protein 18 isoform X1 [Hippocampus zosterae]XP_051944109.1 coiled-coil domain-containing protein 18 isoform X1 [Hippocampus zosterae]
MESVSVKRKMGYARQENARLAMQDVQLITDLDATPYELLSSSSRDHLRCSNGWSVNNVSVMMNEQMLHLETAVETKAKALKAAELRAERCQEEAAHSDIMITTLTEKLSALREELATKTALTKRAEQQRNQALENAEKLKEAFKEYKATTASKLQKGTENEIKLKDSLIERNREKEELEQKCMALEREKGDQSHTISQLKEDARRAKASAAEYSDLQAQLEDAERRSSDLRRQLTERSAECRELGSLREEVEDLRVVTKNQELCLAQSRRATQQSQAEATSLEAILSLLHLREDALGPLCARPCILPPLDYSTTAQTLNLKPGEGYQHLLQVLQVKEAERMKQRSLVERLQDRLSRVQEEILSLQNSLAQSASHCQNLQRDLMDKANQAAASEKELKRKSARVAALEKQLEQKTSAYAQAALKNTELDNQLQEKTSALQHYQTLMSKKQREYQQSLEKTKQSHSQQCTEQKHRIDVLQLSVDEAHSRLFEAKQELTSLQKERDGAQASVEELTQEKQIEARHNEELLQSLKEQAAESATKISALQLSLSGCREELTRHLQQMEEMRKSYESELQRSKDQVRSQQEKLHDATQVAQTSSEQNLQLQLSLQQQQTMLTESTARIAELEESQSQLQQQVSTLEHQLERARAALQDEVRTRWEDDVEKNKDLHDVKEKNTKLAETLNQVTTDVKNYQVELKSKESELQSLRKDVAVKTTQISVMDKNLRQTRSLLENKNDLVVDLEEKLHRCEADKHNCVQKVQHLEGQLHAVREELAETLAQLRLLQDVLQRTQTVAEERQVEVEKLSIRLSETQRELEERTHEVLDMDCALKERQGELQQRATLLGQLDVAIREHKQEMEIKVKALQQSLEAREEEQRDVQRELGETKESHQQQLETLLRELEKAQRHAKALTTQLDSIKLQENELDGRLRHAEEELALKEMRWRQSEAKLQNAVASLEQELDRERNQHDKELESLQQTRGQLLKASSHMSSSQEKLTSKLRQQEIQLDQAKSQLEQTKMELDRAKAQAAHLQTQLEQSQSAQRRSNDLSLDLPPSLKATLKEALSQQPWESSDSGSVDRSWQALSSTEPPSSCDLSFDPFAYMQGDTSASSEWTITEEGDDERVGADTPDEHMSSLKGMLRFVNQTLANQEDPSVLSELPGVVAE